MKPLNRRPKGTWLKAIEIDFDAVRAIVLEAAIEERGSASGMARRLDTTYQVVLRLIRRLGLWSDVDRIRRCAARHAMLEPEPIVTRHDPMHGKKRILTDNTRDRLARDACRRR